MEVLHLTRRMESGSKPRPHKAPPGPSHAKSRRQLRKRSVPRRRWATGCRLGCHSMPSQFQGATLYHRFVTASSNRMQAGTPNAGRVLFTTSEQLTLDSRFGNLQFASNESGTSTAHSSFQGCIVLYTDDSGLTYNYSHSTNLIRRGIDGVYRHSVTAVYV